MDPDPGGPKACCPEDPDQDSDLEHWCQDKSKMQQRVGRGGGGANNTTNVIFILAGVKMTFKGKFTLKFY
jgi:hypothetical protein